MSLQLESLRLPPVPDAANRLDGCVRALVEDLGVEEIWVYGSVARGEAGPHSDVDLLVVASGSQDPKSLRHRAARLLAPLQGALPIGLNVVSAEAWLELQHDAATLFPEIREKGVRLYARHA
jgi:uncharacterized protein